MKKRCIIVDLDSTLCNADHRIYLVEQEKKDWDKFYDEMINDQPNIWCVELVRAMAAINVKPLYITGRPEKYRKLTLNWFDDQFFDVPKENPHSVFCKPYVGEHLWMRADDDNTEDCDMKEQIYRKNIEPDYEILFCIDDRKQVTDKWREIGLTCLACADGLH